MTTWSPDKAVDYALQNQQEVYGLDEKTVRLMHDAIREYYASHSNPDLDREMLVNAALEAFKEKGGEVTSENQDALKKLAWDSITQLM